MTDTSRQVYVDTIKSTFSTLGARATKTWLAANIPFLMAPVINIVVNFVINRMWTEIVNDADLQAFTLFTDIRVGSQGNEMMRAMIDNHNAQLNGTKEEKARAEANLIKAHAALIHLKS